MFREDGLPPASISTHTYRKWLGATRGRPITRDLTRYRGLVVSDLRDLETRFNVAKAMAIIVALELGADHSSDCVWQLLIGAEATFAQERLEAEGLIVKVSAMLKAERAAFAACRRWCLLPMG